MKPGGGPPPVGNPPCPPCPPGPCRLFRVLVGVLRFFLSAAASPAESPVSSALRGAGPVGRPPAKSLLRPPILEGVSRWVRVSAGPGTGTARDWRKRGRRRRRMFLGSCILENRREVLV